MKLLLTSNGISNATIRTGLVDLLGKPIEESSALLVVSGMHPFAGGSTRVVDLIKGTSANKLCGIGWKSLGLLEPTALASVRREVLSEELAQADALLVFGGHVAFLAHWMRQCGLAELLPKLDNLVYVGVSAGAIVTTPFNCDAEFNAVTLPEDTDIPTAVDGGLGFVDFTTWVHVGNPDPMFSDHTLKNTESFANEVGARTYALDDESALSVQNGVVTILTEGQCSYFDPALKP
ncbi:MAG: Type 1 glutamine amidotransferase-like domain-containing protein [Actinomycetes bacterium]